MTAHSQVVALVVSKVLDRKKISKEAKADCQILSSVLLTFKGQSANW